MTPKNALTSGGQQGMDTNKLVENLSLKAVSF